MHKCLQHKDLRERPYPTLSRKRAQRHISAQNTPNNFPKISILIYSRLDLALYQGKGMGIHHDADFSDGMPEDENPHPHQNTS